MPMLESYLIGHAAVHDKVVVEVPPCQLTLGEEHLHDGHSPFPHRVPGNRHVVNQILTRLRFWHESCAGEMHAGYRHPPHASCT